jgi:tetratricopeptide (TPR) repeat protein
VRDGLVALLGVVVAYGVSSAIDWTWFYPGVTLPAMVCAGWLAGRGPLGAAVGLRPRARRTLLARPSTILAVTGILAVSIALAYGVWQPLRSADADGAAIAADASGRLGTALADGQAAVSDFPVSLSALQYLSDFQEAADQPSQAEATLERATREQPQNPASWLALGRYSMTIHEYRVAATAFLHAVDLFYAYVPYQDLFNEAVAKSQRH